MLLLSVILTGFLSVSAAENTRPIPYECTNTKVAKVGTRLSDVPGSGTTVKFTNGVSLSGYNNVAVAEKQRPGDRVQVCLVHVPKKCPPGDERGKKYRVYDYRQKAEYTLSHPLIHRRSA